MNKQTKLTLAAAALTGLLAGAAGRASAATPAPICTSHGLTAQVAQGKAMASVNPGQKAVVKLDGDKHDCAGKNDCKGKGGCKTGDGGCKGKNSCKGKGGCKTDGSL